MTLMYSMFNQKYLNISKIKLTFMYKILGKLISLSEYSFLVNVRKQNREGWTAINSITRRKILGK